MEEEILVSLAHRLGLKGDRIIKKAAEYMRLADIRGMGSTLSSLNLSGSCKGVMCLELAAVAFGEHVDKVTAMRVSGMKNKKIYSNALRAMECLLDLESKVTVTDLVIQFGCPEAKQLTLQVLKCYEEQKNNQDSVEISQILFNTAALYAVCRHLKHRIEKGKLLEITGVTRALFDRLVAHMDKILRDILKDQQNVKEKTNKRCASFVEQLQKISEEQSPIKKTRQTDNEEDEEPFEIWKDRILKAAYEALGKIYPSKS